MAVVGGPLRLARVARNTLRTALGGSSRGAVTGAPEAYLVETGGQGSTLTAANTYVRTDPSANMMPLGEGGIVCGGSS